MTQRPTFRHIAPPLDVDDGALTRLADQLGVPTLVKPAAASPVSAQEPSRDAPQPATRPSPSAKAKDSPTAKKTALPSTPPRHALEKLTVELPGYLIDALKREAIERHVTARHVLMLALQAAGYELRDADLVADARRRKPAKP